MMWSLPSGPKANCPWWFEDALRPSGTFSWKVVPFRFHPLMAGPPDPSYHLTTMSPSMLIAVSVDVVLPPVALCAGEMVPLESSARNIPVSSVTYMRLFCSLTDQ